MRRLMPLLSLLTLAAPAFADGPATPYYGPMKRMGGLILAYSYGYRDGSAKDGAWRVDAATRSGDALDLAMYRAAERARREGYAYIFYLGGSAARSPAYNSATLYARPSHQAVAPTGCRSGHKGTCYTADVAEVMRVLGGPDGTQPGVAIVDHLDRFGREVRVSGYGTGGVAAPAGADVPRSTLATITDGRLVISGGRDAIEKQAGVGLPVASVAPTPGGRASVLPAVPAGGIPSPVPVRALAVVRPVPVAASVGPQRADPTVAERRFAAALRANQPVRGREPQQGWTISD